MKFRRAPLWMYVVAAAFLCIQLVEAYLIVWGPAFPEGLDARFVNDAMHVRSVQPDTAFARAGLKAQDDVLTVSGLAIRTPRDWTAALANIEAERAAIWEIRRDGTPMQIRVIFEKASWKNRLNAGVFDFYFGMALVFFPLGLFIGFSRPHDTAARIGAWLFLSTSVAFGLLNGWAAVWRQLPTILQWLLWIPEISRFVIEGVVLSFFAVFPRRLFRSRWPWLVIWLPVIATLPWRAYGFYSVVYNVQQTATVPSWLGLVSFFRLVLYVVAAIVVLVVNYRWLADRNERRRIRVLLVGTAIGLAATVPVAWGYAFLSYGLVNSIAARLFQLFVLACPLAFAYAILRHRVLDIHLIIRQGLQYAFARGAVLGIVPALAAILMLDLIVNSQQPLATILRMRGWEYAGAGGLAIVAYLRRKQWLEALDHRFFRERYDSQRVLREIVDEMCVAEDFDVAAARAVSRIETALHPEFVSVMIRHQTEAVYSSLASAPDGQGCPPIDAHSKLVGLMRLLGKPLEVLLADSAWLQTRIPEEETELVRKAWIDLLVPVRQIAGESEAFLALGIKRSEEPYTREDQDLLEAIASSLARLVHQPVRSSANETFEECPKCGACYEAKSVRCPIEGATLATVHLPRTLAHRYWLERRRGRGGMGTVYAARDKALERFVALKVIREDLITSPEIAQRFHRESKAAAAFTHPNVVIVHDYGIEGGSRPFLVMELLEGETLRDKLNESRRLEASSTVNIFRGVCAAVEAAHRRQLIHRDLKPENIFLARGADEAGEIVKVLDFGIAKFLPAFDGDTVTRITDETHTGMILGTPAYMSPEQLTGQRPALSWDLWALSVVAYETLTGARPFPTASSTYWQTAILSAQFTPLRAHLPDTPKRWEMFFSQCFSTDASMRPRSASELFIRLEEALM